MRLLVFSIIALSWEFSRSLAPSVRPRPVVTLLGYTFGRRQSPPPLLTSPKMEPPLRQPLPLLASLSSISDGSATAEDDDDASSSSTALATAFSSSRLRRLKDLLWVREAREDLTAAEFACSVEAGEDAERKRKRAVDYEKLLSQLDRRIRDMGCEVSDDAEPFCYVQPGAGMGSIVLDEEQRQAFVERILRTRQLLLEVLRGHELFDEQDLPFSLALPEIRVELPKEESDPSSPGPKLYVRDDGTVDWDGALQDREALRKFGTAVWARINGRDPESIDEAEEEAMAAIQTAKTAAAESGAAHDSRPQKNVVAAIEETPVIKEKREELDILKNELAALERTHIDLLNSAISAGQAVANVNLATLEPALRNRIRNSAEAVEKKKEQVSFTTLIYELERIYSYLMGELGNPALTGYIPLQDRLNVAEFGLLESQIESFNRDIEAGESIDADVLAVVMEQLTDFKRRLGIDYYVTGITFDSDAIRRFFGDLLKNTKKGLAFYAKGTRLFWNDIVFCLTLINRAAQGYTLKPREVRTIR